MDSIIGALGLGDIGRHFPDFSDEYKDISSLVLLGKTYEIMKKKGARIVNIDATLVMQRPKVASYIDKMRQNISEILGCSLDRVNVKATTEEKLGFTGREEGVSAHSVVLLEIKNKVPQLL